MQTNRLELKQLTLDDAQFIMDLVNSKGWLEGIGDRNVKTRPDAETYLKERIFPAYEKGFPYGSWKLELRESLKPVGIAGYFQRDHLQYPDIGFALLPEFMNRGLAFEASKAILEHGRDQLKLPAVFGITSEKNVASIQLLKKLGLSHIGKTKGSNSTEEVLLFEVKF